MIDNELKEQAENIARSIKKAGSRAERLQWLAAGEAIFPQVGNNVPILSCQIAKCYMNGRQAEAEKILRTVLSRYKGHAYATSLLTSLLTDQKKYEEAEGILLSVRQQDRNNPDILQVAGRLYYETNRFDESEAALTALMQLPRTNARMAVLLAKIYMNSNRLAGAEDVLRRAVNEHPNNSVVSNLLAKILGINPKTREEARGLLDQTLAANPDDLYAIVILAHIDRKDGFSAKAVTALEKERQKHPDDHQVRLELVHAYLSAKEPHKAISLIKEMDQDAQDTHKLYVGAYWIMQDLASCMESLNEITDFEWALKFLSETVKYGVGIERYQGALAMAAIHEIDTSQLTKLENLNPIPIIGMPPMFSDFAVQPASACQLYGGVGGKARDETARRVASPHVDISHPYDDPPSAGRI